MPAELPRICRHHQIENTLTSVGIHSGTPREHTPRTLPPLSENTRLVAGLLDLTELAKPVERPCLRCSNSANASGRRGARRPSACGVCAPLPAVPSCASSPHHGSLSPGRPSTCTRPLCFVSRTVRVCVAFLFGVCVVALLELTELAKPVERPCRVVTGQGSTVAAWCPALVVCVCCENLGDLLVRASGQMPSL